MTAHDLDEELRVHRTGEDLLPQVLDALALLTLERARDFGSDRLDAPVDLALREPAERCSIGVRTASYLDHPILPSHRWPPLTSLTDSVASTDMIRESSSVGE